MRPTRCLPALPYRAIMCWLVQIGGCRDAASYRPIPLRARAFVRNLVRKIAKTGTRQAARQRFADAKARTVP